jgi:hypothetical protein
MQSGSVNSQVLAGQWQHQYMAVSLLSPGMKAEFQAHATQELDHANRLAERIQQLGQPIYDPKEIAQKAAMSVSYLSKGPPTKWSRGFDAGKAAN